MTSSLPPSPPFHEKDALRRQIEATDRRIDEVVYELYGATEVVVGIVEGEPAARAERENS